MDMSSRIDAEYRRAVSGASEFEFGVVRVVETPGRSSGGEGSVGGGDGNVDDEKAAQESDDVEEAEENDVEGNDSGDGVSRERCDIKVVRECCVDDEEGWRPTSRRVSLGRALEDIVANY
jgi:hypothetical protein